jgi:hypothetical protein
MRHPLQNWLIWKADWRTWAPALVFAAIIIFLAIELAFDPGPPAPPPAH